MTKRPPYELIRRYGITEAEAKDLYEYYQSQKKGVTDEAVLNALSDYWDEELTNKEIQKIIKDASIEISPVQLGRILSDNCTQRIKKIKGKTTRCYYIG